jgi:cysteine desulfurase/selenocysteine lyase
MNPRSPAWLDPDWLDPDWLDTARADTPGTNHVVHFNNAGSALPTTATVDAVIAHVRREAEIGGYEAVREAAPRLDRVYTSLAALINARAEHIAVVENATRAWDMAVYGFPFRRGDRVLTGRSEYASNAIALLQLQRRHGIEIVLVDDDADGQISLAHLEQELAAGAVMVALTHAPTNGGLINPAEAVGALCRRFGAFYVLDACQSVGQLPIDVEAIGCDVLSATSRKYLRGPRGMGFLSVSDRALRTIEPPFLDLHAATWTSVDSYEIRADAKRFENWETNYAAKLGLGVAVDYALELGVDRTWPYIQELAGMLRRELEATGTVDVYDKGAVRGGIVTFTVDGFDAEHVQAALAASYINTSISLPEYARYDLAGRRLPTLVRASVHYYNTPDEVARLLDALPR